MLQYARAHGYARVEATPEAEQRWTEHVEKMYSTMLMRKAKSWFTGYNSNVDGHEDGKIRYFVYNGGAPKWTAALRDVAESGYQGIAFKPEPRPVAGASGAGVGRAAR